MKKIIFAQDSGYGVDKYAYRNAEGQIKYGKVNSAIAEAPIDTQDMPLFEGRRFYLGEIALLEDSSKILDILDYKDHERFAPLSLWHAFEESKVDKENIGCISVGLSLAQYNYQANFVKRLSKFSVNKENFDFTGKLALFPQGVGARYAIDSIYYKDAPDEDKNYAIIDIGQLTVDTVTVFGGKARQEAANGTAHQGIVKITQNLQEHIAADAKLKSVLSMKELQKIIQTGKYLSFGEEYDFSKIIENFKKEYTLFLLTALRERQKNIFQKIAKIYIIGGGAYYLDRDVMSNFQGIPFKSFVITKNSEYLNAIGNLLGAEKMIGEGRMEGLNIADFNQAPAENGSSNNGNLGAVKKEKAIASN
jgi:hypothetical protein